jgi:hypothetical protein
MDGFPTYGRARACRLASPDKSQISQYFSKLLVDRRMLRLAMR